MCKTIKYMITTFCFYFKIYLFGNFFGGGQRGSRGQQRSRGVRGSNLRVKLKLTYEEIALKGGGILNSARKLSEQTEEELYESALKRLKLVQSFGTGAIEIKPFKLVSSGCFNSNTIIVIIIANTPSENISRRVLFIIEIIKK